MDEENKRIIKQAHFVFTLWAIIDAVAFITMFLLHRAGLPPALDQKIIWTVGIVILMSVAIIAVATPILLRSLFMAKTIKTRQFSLDEYRRLLIWTIILPMGGAFAASIAYFFMVPKLHLLTTMMFSLYGVYSAIPARKKITGEIIYFRSRFS